MAQVAPGSSVFFAGFVLGVTGGGGGQRWIAAQTGPEAQVELN